MAPFLAAEDFAGLRELRAADPAAIKAAMLGRRRRDVVRGDGRLFIVAADHPARGRRRGRWQSDGHGGPLRAA